MYKRWKRLKNGYIFDRYIFKGTLAVIFVYLLVVCWAYDFNFKPQIYIKCNQATPCKNPFYVPENGIGLNPMPEKIQALCVYDFCQDEYLPAGFEFGKKPSPAVTYAWLIISIKIAFAFALNHLLHNRKGKAKLIWEELEK